MTRLLAILLLLPAIASAAGLGVYNPAQHAVNGFMPTQLGAKLWLAANHLGIANNDSVADWADFSGFNNNVTQSTLSKRPIYKISARNGRPALLWDGVDDVLSSTQLVSTISNPYTVFAVGIDANAVGYWYDSFTSTNRTAALYDGTSQLLINSGGDAISTTNKYTNVFSVFTFVLNRTSSEIRIAGNLINLQNPNNTTGSNNVLNLSVGNRYTHDNTHNGHYFELIMFPSALSQPQRLQVERYLGTKYGIVVQ